MGADVCRQCGDPLPGKAGGRGRVSLYCSAACRQKAYRVRQNPAEGETVERLIAGIRARAGGLAPTPPLQLDTDARVLASLVRRLRGLARDAITQDAITQDAVTQDAVTLDAPVENVTREGVTQEEDFAALAEAHQHELRVHCYRMLGSFDEAEDLVQETFLRAWRGRETYQGRASLRAWLYRIATNACLDHLDRHKRTPEPYPPMPGAGPEPAPTSIAWLQPYPDLLLEQTPESAAVTRETIELVFLAAIQHLPPLQRAVLILRDVLGWPAKDTAALLDMSLASVNSALQRARPAVRRQLPERRADWTAPAEVSEQERDVLHRYIEASRDFDAAAVAELYAEDIKLTMPPDPLWFVGREAILAGLSATMDPSSPQYFGAWEHVLTSANRQPATAGYVRRPGTSVYRAQVLNVLRIENGLITEITAFEPHLFPAFGLPLTL
ncbi:RNA polymerase subunit sigma-70 [Nonomuraea sp. NPDC046570]|uniref:RNA polymerase subunit sigma-70 n=1 Tax=Nonomuraea sp. NPDC046570 TaxID=3155255 RepID=UPI00340F9AC1